MFLVDASLWKPKACHLDSFHGWYLWNRQIRKRCTWTEAWVMDSLYANRIDDEFNERLDEYSLTKETLTQKAKASSLPVFESLEQMITLFAKTQAGFQGSYEMMINIRWMLRGCVCKTISCKETWAPSQISPLILSLGMSTKASAQRRQTNRRNALRSTGPNSTTSKRRSSKNTGMHGLSVTA